MQHHTIIQITPEELQTIINRAIQSALSNLELVSKDEEQLLTIEETASFLNLSIQTIYSKVARRELPNNKRGKRLYFFKSELMDYIKKGRRATNDEIDVEASDYLIMPRNYNRHV